MLEGFSGGLRILNLNHILIIKLAIYQLKKLFTIAMETDSKGFFIENNIYLNNRILRNC